MSLSNNPTLSIIIPVYNGSGTIARCLESILQQTDSSVEVICINDGSMDSTGSIIEEYARAHNNVLAFTIDNSGPSSARSEGLKHAHGRFVAFADSDDFYEKNMLQHMMHELICHDDIDCAVFDYLESPKENITRKSGALFPSIGLMSVKQYLLSFCRPENIMLVNVLFNKVYRADIARKIQFDTNVSLGEDALYNYEFYARANKILVDSTGCYVYENYSQDSLSRGRSLTDIWNAYTLILTHLHYLLNKYHLTNLIWNIYAAYVLNVVHAYIRKEQSSSIDDQIFKEAIKVRDSAFASGVDTIFASKFDFLIVFLIKHKMFLPVEIMVKLKKKFKK